MPRRKTKYTIRADGLIMMNKTMPNGKRKAFYGHSDDEVEKKYLDALKAIEKQSEKPIRAFKDVAESYWDSKEPTLSPNSMNAYKVAIRRCEEEFGDIQVSKITPQDVYAFLARFSAKGYSQKVIGNTKSVLKSIFDEAFIAGEIPSNPCTTIPSVKGKPKTPREPASDSDIKLIEQHKNDNNISRMYYFMLYSGLRRGEATALQYKHIDRKSKTVKVEQSCAWDNSIPILKLPKTQAGIRTVDLTDNALDVIPEGHDPDEYVFFPDGLPKRRFIEGGFEDFRAETGIKATPHQLRHSYASLLHSANIDVKDAQALLGHSTVAMTQDIYTHLEQNHKKDVQKKLNKYVKKKRML